MGYHDYNQQKTSKELTMYLTSSSRLLIAATLFVLSWSTSALAASISVVSSGDASYVIQGNSMDGVAGIELTIRYEAALFQGTPAVKQESLISGAMLAANTSLPGTIKIAIISTRSFSGSGPIATISFSSKSPAAPLPTVSHSMIDSKGSALASSTDNVSADPSAPGNIASPGIPFSQPSQQTPSPVHQQSTDTAGAPGTVATSTPTYPGTITLPTEQQQQADAQPPTSPVPPPAPVHTEEPAAPKIEEPTHPPAGKPVPEAKIEETPQYVLHKGVLDRFKQYKGSKQLSAAAALFDKKVAQNIHQEPAILLSDGNSKAILTVDIPSRITSSPNFAANGGKLVSFRQDKQSKGRWTIEVLPDAGAVRVTVTIIVGAEEFEYPLTVAPPAKTALTLDEPGWNRFLKEVGTSSAPQHDLNNDGLRDYVDEYIFVANHIARKSVPAKPASLSR